MARFNIKRLMIIGDFNVSEVCEKNSSTKAEDYYDKMELFMERQEELDRSVNSEIVDIKENDYFVKKILEIQNLLFELGCSNFDPPRKELFGHNDKYSMDYVKTITKQLGDIYTRVKEIHTPDKIKATGEEAQYKASILLIDLINEANREETNRQLRILAVDDVAIILHTLTSVLSPDYEVFALSKGTQVKRFLMNTTPELFLLDIEMPDINGYDIIPIIREFKEHKDTPIIFLTGLATSENLKAAVAAGVCDFIVKPIDPKILLEKVKKHIVRKKLY